MTAAYVTELGGTDTIQVGALPVPRPGPTDVLVRVEAAAVNLADAYVFSGTFPTALPMPYIVGTDLVGTVVETGSEAVSLRTGQQVWCNSMGRGGRQGPTAQYAVVPADRLYPLPPGVDPHVAVALAQPAATAYLGWFTHAKLRPGETVFVGGGAGNIGTAAIQVARQAGARVIASARPDDFAHCRAAGAEAVCDFTDSGLADHIADHAPDGVDVVWETSGHHDFDLVTRVAALGCRVVLSTGANDEPLPVAAFYMKDIAALGFVISLAAAADLAEAAGLINQMLEHGQLTTQIADWVPLAQTAAAHRRLWQGGVRGRLLVTM